MIKSSVRLALLMSGVLATNPEGWSLRWRGQPTPAFAVDGAPGTAPIDRVGYDNSGAVTSYRVNRAFTIPKRQPYPYQTSTVDKTGALDDYIYATDLTPGVTNRSIVVCPKPDAAWVMPDRQCVDDWIDWEIIAAHRDAGLGGAQEIACVQVRATDETIWTDWETVGTSTISTLCEDRNSVEVFKGRHFVGGLVDVHMVRMEARVIPWAGGAASIATTGDFSGLREFSPRYFWRDTARYATPPRATVASTGSDTTGTWTTNGSDPTLPFLTPMGAAAKANAQITYIDGAHIEIIDTVTLGTIATTTSVRQYCAPPIVTRSAGTSRAAALVQFGTASTRTQLGTNNTLLSPLIEGVLCFKDVSVQRTGASSISNSSFSGGTELKAVLIQWWNVNFDNGSQVATYLGGSPISHDAMYGYDMINPPSVAANAPVWGNSGNAEHRIFRGFNGTMNRAIFQPYLVVGSTMTAPGNNGSDPGTTSQNAGAMIHSTKFLQIEQSCLIFNTSANDVTITRLSLVNVLQEWTGTNNVYGCLQICNSRGSTRGVVLHNVTVVGAGQAGRCNVWYDGFATTPAKSNQSHELASAKGIIWSQFNTKGDIFLSDSTLIGYFPINHGVGLAGNWELFTSNTGPSYLGGESLYYPGPGSQMAPSNTSIHDPLFVNNQASTWNGVTITPGAGGGDYHLQGGSGARSLLPAPLMRFDIAGNVRSGAQAAGCYA